MVYAAHAGDFPAEYAESAIELQGNPANIMVGKLRFVLMILPEPSEPNSQRKPSRS